MTLPAELCHALVSPSESLCPSGLGTWQHILPLILPLILRYLNLVDPGDSAALSACMRVSKGFQMIAAPSLYHTFTLRYHHKHDWYISPCNYGQPPSLDTVDCLKQLRIRSLWVLALLHRLAPTFAECLARNIGLLDFLKGNHIRRATPLNGWDRLRLVHRVDVNKRRAAPFYITGFKATKLPLPNNRGSTGWKSLPKLDVGWELGRGQWVEMVGDDGPLVKGLSAAGCQGADIQSHAQQVC